MNIIYSIVLCGLTDYSRYKALTKNTIQQYEIFDVPFMYVFNDIYIRGSQCNTNIIQNVVFFGSFDGEVAKTVTYNTNGIQYWHMYINADMINDDMTFSVILLHEFGHVYGLKHPPPNTDSIMGYSAIIERNGKMLEEVQYIGLTWIDANDLLDVSQTYCKDRNLDGPNVERWRDIMSTFPDTISEQRTMCRLM